MIAKCDNTAEAMNEKQYRLLHERNNTETVKVAEPKHGGGFGRFKALVVMAALAFVMSFMPTMAMAQEATLTDVDATVEVVHLFDYGALAMSYLTTTGGVYAIMGGILITLGIAGGFIYRLSNRRSV
ncbi:MAG: hypothetical protein ACF8OB_12950 [Phycisphaeraceae bacterium JB051]